MSQVITIAQNFIKKVQADGLIVDKAFLFGSYAIGKEKTYSDIDICIVSPQLGKDFVSEMVRLQGLAHKVDMRIEAIPFHPDRLNDPYDSLASEIRKYGISLTS